MFSDTLQNQQTMWKVFLQGILIGLCVEVGTAASAKTVEALAQPATLHKEQRQFDTLRTAKFAQDFAPFFAEADRLYADVQMRWQKFERLLFEKTAPLSEPAMKRYIYRRAAEVKTTLDSVMQAFKATEQARLDSLQRQWQAVGAKALEERLIAEKATQFERLEHLRQRLEQTLETALSTLASNVENLLAVEADLQAVTPSARRRPADRPQASTEPSSANTHADEPMLPAIPTPLGLNFSLTYSSQAIWYGIQQNVFARNETDVVSSGVLSLSGTYTHPIGVWGGLEVVGLFGQSPFLDQLTLSLGIEQTIFDRLTIGAQYSRYFYSANSVQFSAFISDNLGLYLTFVNPIVTPSVNVNYGFAQGRNVLFLTLSGSHTFTVEPFFGGVLFISPSAYLDFGSLVRYTLQVERQAQLPQRSLLRGRRMPEFALQRTASYTFMPLNATLTVSLSYALGNFSLSPALSLALPLNTPNYTLELTGVQPPVPNRSQALGSLSEPKNPIVYVSLAASITL